MFPMKATPEPGIAKTTATHYFYSEKLCRTGKIIRKAMDIFLRIRPLLLFALWLVLAGTGGCALALREDSPKAEEIDAAKIQLGRALSFEQTSWPEAGWWRSYNDEQLNGLINLALQNSPGMAAARERVAVAQSKARLAEAGGGPLIGGMANINRQHLSDAGFLGIFSKNIPALGLTGPWYTTGTMGFVGSYTFDFWGLDRAKIDAAIGAANAALAEEAQARLVLAATVTRGYYGLQTLYAVLDLQKEALGITNEMVAAHAARHSRGLEPRTLSELALAQKAEIEKQIAATDAAINTSLEMLRALIGLTRPLPEITPAPLPAVPAALPPSLGYDLLARRADLQAARWYIQASLRGVDAARAAFYPNFDIKVFFGLDALHLEDLLQKGSQQFDFIPGLSLPIFDSGRLNANLAVTRSESNMIIAEYNQAVVNAVFEVARSGWELSKLEKAIELQQIRLNSVNYAAESAAAHYGTGLMDRVSSLEARLPAIAEEALLLDLLNQRIAAGVDLTMALGGGFYSAEDPLAGK